MTANELTPQQKRFVAEYLVDLNGTKAAIRAGYAERSATMQASRLLTNDNISTLVKQGIDKLLNKIEVNAENIKQELTKCGFSNMQDYMSVDGNGYPHLDFSKLTREQAAALGEVTVEEYVEGKGENARPVKKVKFKLLDKLSALEKLGKHLGMFKEENKQSVHFHFDGDMARVIADLAKPVEAEIVTQQLDV